MIIVIGGDSHTGKTLLAQNLMEKYKIPYTSIDHIKMGIFRGYANCGFNPNDGDEFIAEKLFGVIKGIVDTCYENGQNIILEGVIPPNLAKKLIKDGVFAVYLGFSKSYILENFDTINFYENIIENRRYKDERTIDEVTRANLEIEQECKRHKLLYFEIATNYNEDIKKVYQFVENSIMVINKQN